MSSFSKPEIFEEKPPIARNYGDRFLVFDHGKGVWLWDRGGNKYLDFGSGIAVNSFGHGRSDFARIVSTQMKRVVHVSNLYSTPQTINLVRKLIGSSPLSKHQPYHPVEKGGTGPYFKSVHLGNSGSEANESALKYARIYSKRKANPNGTKFLAFESAFHGRTMGALSVTHNKTYREPSDPLIPGVEFLPFNDVEALRKTLDSSFAAVIVEPIQGEGGLTPMTLEFAAELNKLCRLHDVVLIADEIQTGIGRTGKLYGSEWFGLEPDIVNLAKPLAAGLPLSATMLTPKIADIVQPGDHGSTFGGGPVTCALAGHVWDMITAPAFLPMINEKSAWLERGLEALRKDHKWLGELRGKGMLRGVVVNIPESGGLPGDTSPKPGEAADPAFMVALIEAVRKSGLIVLRSGKNVLRLAPPLIINEQQLRHGFELLDKVLTTVEKGALHQN